MGEGGNQKNYLFQIQEIRLWQGFCKRVTVDIVITASISFISCSRGNDDQTLEVDTDLTVGSDGAYSAIRRELMKRPR